MCGGISAGTAGILSLLGPVYGKHYPDDIREKDVKTKMKTSMRKAANLFRIIGSNIISSETVRKYIPPALDMAMVSSGYFVEEILDYLKEETL